MAINNPYVPGDPFSYDLKWIVRKLKENVLLIEEMKKIIDELPAMERETFYTVNTVADMQALDLEVGDYINTRGYYEAGDGGANCYVIINDPLLYPYYIVIDTGKYAVPVVTGTFVTPEMFGAKADNLTDDAQALLWAAAWAAAFDKNLTTTAGKDYLIDRDIDLKGVNNINFKGAINNTGHALTFGPSDLIGRPDNYYFDRVEGKLKMKGGSCATIYIGYCDELELWADSLENESRYLAYCTFNFGYARSLKIHAYHTGWINENKFFGMRLVELEIDGDTNPNNNSFYGAKIEGETFNLVKGYSNHFYDLRFESSVSITFGPATHNNILEISWMQYMQGSLARNVEYMPQPVSSNQVTDNGVDNYVVMAFDAFQHREKFFDLAEVYNAEHVTMEADGSLTMLKNKEIFKSKPIKIEKACCFYLTSTERDFRMQVYVRDASGNPVTSDVSQYVVTNLNYNQGSGLFSNSTGLGSDTAQPYFSIIPNNLVNNIVIVFRTVNYDPDSWNVKFARGYVISNKRYPVGVTPEGNFSHHVSGVIPAAGMWKQGDIVYNINPTTGQPLGWICKTEGTPGTWLALPNL